MASVDLYSGSQQRTFLGHPIGLTICFLTEMWERFSYYGMRTILVLYLVKYHLYSAQEASFIYGAYAGLVYICLLYTSPSPRDKRQSRMPSSA